MNHGQVLLALNRCHEVHKARITPNHPCAIIVGTQQPGNFQAPEPWRGHIDSAPILFISSNPGIGGSQGFPPSDWTDEQVIAHYQGCFDQENLAPSYIDEKLYSSIRFWQQVRGRAGEILGRRAKQGTDFALTEVVHCKSLQERGVWEARFHCGRLWMESVLEQSAAKVVVLLGRHAKDVCSELWSLQSHRSVDFGVDIGGKERGVVILPHPNARQRRKLADFATEDEILRLRVLINSD